MTAFQFTRFVKTDGPLTKRVALTPDGSVKSDGSACVMSRGSAHRVHLADVQHLADLIGQLQPNEAIATGTLRPDLPDTVKIITKRRLDEINGAAHPGTIARTGGHIVYRPGQPAFALLDFDVKGKPAAVAERLQESAVSGLRSGPSCRNLPLLAACIGAPPARGCTGQTRVSRYQDQVVCT